MLYFIVITFSLLLFFVSIIVYFILSWSGDSPHLAAWRTVISLLSFHPMEIDLHILNLRGYLMGESLHIHQCLGRVYSSAMFSHWSSIC